MQSADDFEAIYSYLRRTYYLPLTGLWDSAALIALGTTAYASATKEVVITATNSEAGGAAQGMMKFNKMVLLQAIEKLLAEECPDDIAPWAPSSTIVNFGARYVQL